MSRQDTITAQFCGSKKSLVHGTAMSKVIFAGYGGIGVLLLPIMLYHALQLMVVSAIARRAGRTATDFGESG
jgi:sodium/bile acid cotransporter 7